MKKAQVKISDFWEMTADDFMAACSEQVLVVETDWRALGKLMRRLRVECGLSVRKVARLMGYSAAFVSDCELGRRHFTPVCLKLFLAACRHPSGFRQGRHK